jgi:heme o synthase
MVFRHYLQLAKAPITAMVLVTTAVGYVLASAEAIHWAGLGWTLLGTGLAAAGAATLNQVLETDRDAKMRRTCGRPLPAGLISRWHAFGFGMITVAVGVEVLNRFVNPLTALLGLANVLIYVLIYTPLKPRTSLNTLVGSICGALPPVMGWTGAANNISIEPLLLGGILFLWQVPHSLSFVWLYRDDYAKAGYRMLPVVDPTGRFTCLAILLYWLALMPLGLVITFRGMAGCLFAAASLLMGLALFLLSLQLRAAKTEHNARRMFFASIAYLPLLLAMMVADRPSQQVHHDKQHAPYGIQEVPIDGRVANTRMVGD